MVKKFFIIALFVASLFGASAEQIISNLGGGDTVVQNSIDEKGNPDILVITRALQAQNKLKFSFNNPVNFELIFNSNGNGMILLKAVKNMLFRLGYANYENISFVNSDNSSYSILVNSQKVADPGDIYKLFVKSNIIIENVVKKSDFKYEYTLNTQKANLYAPSFGSEYKEPITPYFINVLGKSKVVISSQKSDVWHPDIKIYDSNLKLLEHKVFDDPMQNLRLDLPAEAHYIQVDDTSSLKNIKNGLKFDF